MDESTTQYNCNCYDCLQEADANGECNCKCRDCSGKRSAREAVSMAPNSNNESRQQRRKASEEQPFLSTLRNQQTDVQTLLKRLDDLEHECKELDENYQKDKQKIEQEIEEYPAELEKKIKDNNKRIQELQKDHNHKVMQFNVELEEGNRQLSELRESGPPPAAPGAPTGGTATAPARQTGSDDYGTATEDVLEDLDRLQGVLSGIRQDIEVRKQTLVVMTIHYEKVLSENKLQMTQAFRSLNDELEARQLALKNYDIEKSGQINNLKNQAKVAQDKLQSLETNPPKRLTPLMHDSKKNTQELEKMTALLESTITETKKKLALVLSESLKKQEHIKCELKVHLSHIKTNLAGAKSRWDALEGKEDEYEEYHEHRLEELGRKIQQAQNNKERIIRDAQESHAQALRDLIDAFERSRQQLEDRAATLDKTEANLNDHYKDLLVALQREIKSETAGNQLGYAELNLGLDENCKLIGELTTQIEHERHRLGLIIQHERQLKRMEFGDINAFFEPKVKRKMQKIEALSQLLQDTARGIAQVEASRDVQISKDGTRGELEKSAKRVEKAYCAVKSITKQITSERERMDKSIQALEDTIDYEKQKYLQDKEQLVKETYVLAKIVGTLTLKQQMEENLSRPSRNNVVVQEGWTADQLLQLVKGLHGKIKNVEKDIIEYRGNFIPEKGVVFNSITCFDSEFECPLLLDSKDSTDSFNDLEIRSLPSMRKSNSTLKRQLKQMSQKRKLISLLSDNSNQFTENETVHKLGGIVKFYIKENQRLCYEKNKLLKEMQNL